MTDDTDDFLFAQHVGLNSPDFIFAFWGSVAWVPLISFYFSGVQPHLGAPQGDSDVGYQIIFGHPVSSQITKKKKVARTLFNGQQGGVALAFKPHVCAEIAPLGSSERRLRLWQSKRWLHVMAPYGSGHRAIHVFVFYGHSGQYSNNSFYELNEVLLHDVLAEAHLYRDLPCILLADLNCEPQDSETCRQACIRDGWTDAAVAAGQLGPTHYPTHGSPRRLDVVFLNKTAAVTFQQYRALDDCGLPGHLPVKVQLSLAALRTLYNQPIKPKDFTADQLCSLPAPQEEQLAQSCFHSFAKNWDSAFQASDPNRLWQYWNSFTEDFLCKRANISQPVKYSGRGHFPKFVQQPASGTSRPIKHGGTQTTVRERMLRKLARQIDFFLGQCPTTLGTHSHHLDQLRKKILHRCQLLHITFDDNNLSSIRDSALKEADNLSNNADVTAIQRWRDKIKVDFLAHKRETYKWLSREYSCPQTFLKKADTFTANSKEIDSLVRAIWQPIMNRSPSESLPSWEQFRDSFGAFFPDCPQFSIPPLTIDELRKSVQNMSIFQLLDLITGLYAPCGLCLISCLVNFVQFSRSLNRSGNGLYRSQLVI